MLGGFLFLWLCPLFTGVFPATLAGVWTAFVHVTWSGVLLLAGFWAVLCAWGTFRYETELGRALRLFGWLTNLWR